MQRSQSVTLTAKAANQKHLDGNDMVLQASPIQELL